jgi:hypothetical protein
VQHGALTGLLISLAGGCLDTGRERVSIPLRVAGVAPTAVAGAGGWTITLASAELAFGPLYLCAGEQAGALCETARLEWTESIVVDALDPEPRVAGALQGVSGPVRSWMYDLGITSLLTQQRPAALAAALELGENSVRLSGVARRAERELPFELALPIQQDEAAELGACVVRKSTSDPFVHEITGDEIALTVRFDPRPWLLEVDIDALTEDPASAQAKRALRNALVAGARPSFEWGAPRDLLPDP